MNLNARLIPPQDPNGGYELSGTGKKYNKDAIVNLAVSLLHELFHKYNPQVGPETECDLEAPAYKFTQEAMCIIVGCDDYDDDDVKDALCELINKINDYLCIVCCDSELTECPACDAYVPVPGGACAWVQPPPLTLVKHEIPKAGGSTGQIIVNPGAGTFVVDVHSYATDVATKLEVKFSSIAGFEDFAPLSFTQIHGGASVVAGYDGANGLGWLVSVTYDLSQGTLTDVSTLTKTSAIEHPIDVEKVPGAMEILILDRGTPAELQLIDLRDPTLPKVLFTESTLPGIESTAYLNVGRTGKRAGGFLDVGAYGGLWADLSSLDPEVPLFVEPGPDDVTIMLFDMDADGQFDEQLVY